MKLLHALALAALLPDAALAQASLNTGSAPVQGFTPANSSHVAGKGIGAQTATALGALISFPVARAPGGSGDALQLILQSVGGDTPTVQVKLWDVLPLNTTCEDNTSNVSNAADDSHLIVPPFTLTLAAPTNTTGDAKTYASISWAPPLSFRNQDPTTTTRIVYGCLTATGTFTPAAAGPPAWYVTLTAVQD